MNTQSQPGSQLSQLRSMMESMSVATLSSIDKHDALLSCRVPRWEMDDCGALWFFTDALWLSTAQLPSINLSFANAAGTRCVSLFGRGALYAEDLSTEYLLGAIWLGHINVPFLTVEAPLNNLALLKFTPQSAVYWQAQPSLVMHLLAVVRSLFGAEMPPVKPGMHCVELPLSWMQRRQQHDVL